MADLADRLEEAARKTAAERYARARASDKQDAASFRNTTDKLVNFAKSEPQYAPYYREFLTRDKAPAYSLDELAAAAPAFAPKKIAAAIQQPTAGQQYEGASTDSESVFPRPSPPPKKQTGATGPPKPEPEPDPSKPLIPNKPAIPGHFDRNGNWINPGGGTAPLPSRSSGLNNPALENFVNTFRQNSQTPDWRDRAAAQADSLQNQFHGPPQMIGYHWFAGTGGVSGGNDAGMQVFYSDGSSNWVQTPKPGEFPPVAGNTRMNQNAMYADATTRAGAGGGILPSWNSPTGQAVDLRANGPQEIDTSAAGPTPPSGWLDRAIRAARSGAPTYNTGGTKDEGNSPAGGIVPHSPQGSYIGTPSGGTMAIPAAPNNNQGPLREGIEQVGAGVRSAMEDRSALYNRIAQANVPLPTLNQPKHEEWDSSQSGGNYGG